MRVAVIPARGGSKRIPRKNIRPFCGRPMIAYSLAAAQATGLFDHIVVSTDDAEIAEVARQHGAEIPFLRPAELADDRAGLIAVVSHAARWMGERGWPVDAVCCILATAPFLTAGDLTRAWQEFARGGWDYVFSAATFAYPPQRALRRTPGGGMVINDERYLRRRSQDLDPLFHDAGQFYWGKTDAWLEQRPDFSEQSTALILPRWQVQDIDTEEDWTSAEIMMSVLKQRGDLR